LNEIDPISRTIIDAKFADAAEVFRVADQAQFDAVNAELDTSASSFITKLVESAVECIGFADIDHESTIVHRSG
jgi:hypothetical protein